MLGVHDGQPLFGVIKKFAQIAHVETFGHGQTPLVTA